jgi:hypothetical protein
LDGVFFFFFFKTSFSRSRSRKTRKDKKKLTFSSSSKKHAHSPKSMVAVAAPPRAGRALGSYPMAQAVCDGFGAGGGVTWRKVAALVEKNVEQVEAAARETERREKL